MTEISRTWVVVIGAGIVGVATALNLQRKGVDVVLVDERGPGEGASHGNAGVLATCGIVPVPVPGILAKMPALLRDPLGPLSLDPLFMARNARWFWDYLRHGSEKEVNRLASELIKLTANAPDEHFSLAKGTRGEGLVTKGDYLYVYPQRANWEKEAFSWDVRRRNGIRFEEIGQGDLRELEPDLSPEFSFAIRLPGHGFSVDPGKLVKSLAESFRENGGHILQAKVRTIERHEGRAIALITDAGRIEFEKVVVAAGAWSNDLLAPLGLKVPLISERGYHVEFRDPGIRHNHPLMVTSGKYVVTPMCGRLRLAGIVEFRNMSDAPRPLLWERLRKHAKRVFPSANLNSIDTWMGHRPSLPDSLPVIGEVPWCPNLILAFGHQHIGLTTGPKTGRLVAQLTTGEPSNENLSAFSITRFGLQSK